MDQIKIGRFIAERRKMAGLTQMQLAEHFGITDRAISKWETGKSLPDSSIMIELCKLLKITVNDLLSGEIVNMNDRNEKNDKVLLEMLEQKEQADRRFLIFELVIGFMSMFVFLSLCAIAALAEIQNWLRIVLIVIGSVTCIVGVCFGLRIEQTAGYYECERCHHKYVPKYMSVFFAMHINRTRYMKCPKCNKRSWQKKTLKKD